MQKSTVSRRSRKPKYSKPYKDFPLTAHPSGRWVKKFNKASHYFGPIGASGTEQYEANWRAALDRFNREWPYILKGESLPQVVDEASECCTLRVLCNEFLASKRNKMETGELTERSYRDYFRSCKLLIEHFGKNRAVESLRPLDFEAFRKGLAKNLSAGTLGNEITRCRVIFKFAADQELIPVPVKFGQSFERPSKKTLRRVRNEAGPKMFDAAEIRTLLRALEGASVSIAGQETPVTLKPDPQLKAMILLGINGGLGNTDCSGLTESHLDLNAGWMSYPRPKTEIPRKIPLWPETVTALSEVVERRLRPRTDEDQGLVFLTRSRRRWVRMAGKGLDVEGNEKPRSVLDDISRAFGKLLHALNINGRNGLGFYTLRRTFEIQAGESKDQVAVDAIMGHTDESMAAVYRQGQISEDRLRAVVDVVHRWLRLAE
ncbi:tyrosine-type recombinase/integrase [Planctomicrobium sp. SH668]|uniref:tyrosine-type recombinase/integrase n=1 Tax=Planctomicrobium sp. SH668 TaxID=3448126 RepID=UPI003F5BA563